MTNIGHIRDLYFDGKRDGTFTRDVMSNKELNGMMVSSRIEPIDPVFKNFKILLEICRTVFSPSVSDFEFIL